MTLKNWVATARGLGIAAAIGLVLCALALHDIAHGEADVRLEWGMVQIGLLLMALFIAATFVTLRRLRNAMDQDVVGN